MSPALFVQHVALAVVAIGIAVGYLALAAAEKVYERFVEKVGEEARS